MKKLLLFVFILSALFSICAYEGTTIGPEVSELNGKKLQWEAGSFDYFVMFKSLMGNDIREICTDENSPAGCDWEDNPEPDSCLPQSTFKLTNQHVPEDAYVEAAYLVWTSSLDPNNVLHTDNTATLNFVSDDGQITYETDAVAPRIGNAGTDANPGIQDFTFEGITTESGGTIYGGYYTYRVDVTDFFTMIHAMGRDLGYKSDGMSLYGNYTVSGVECSNSSDYLSQIVGYNGYSASVMCGWSLITVYRSTRVNPKMVYIYNGFGRFCKQYADLGISGFEFPDKPIIKMTMAVHEGDPGLASATGCGGMLGGGACPPEGLQVTGQTTPPEDLLILQNSCNPAKFVDSSGTAFNYSDTYNSISSFYGWNDTTETCIGGNPNSPDPNSLEYTMDVDTFLLDAESNPDFDRQFKKGDNSMFIKIGANQDCIYPNYMVVSLDTKAPRYDIPLNPVTPDGREKNYCSCSEQADTICSTAPFYFMIKIQNWGNDLSTNVTVQDTLPNQVSYVSGTTEMCKEWKSDNVCKKWEPVEDANGAFPLADPYKVADVLGYCDQVAQTCDETIMIRFKVKPKDNLPKNEVIENTAIINDDNQRPYRTNTSIPLRLTFGNCPSPAACENPDLTNCGGYGDGAGCEKDEECGAGQVCRNGGCVVDDSLFTSNAKITVAKGKNSPLSESAIIVPAPTKNLVMGQFTVTAMTEEKDKNFSFESVIASLSANDNDTEVTNIRLVYDKNGNGIFDDGDVEVTDPQSVKTNIVSLALKNGSTAYKVNDMHYFIIVADVSYKKPDSIPVNTGFKFSIENIGVFSFGKISGASAEMTEEPMNFAEFSFEPTVEAFVFTKGSVEPPVPSLSNMNKSPVGILQIRAKAVAHTNSIKKITLKTTSKSVKFKEGIEKIEVYLDTDRNASKENEMKLATAVPSETSNLLDIVFDTPLSFESGEEKTLLLVASFNIPKDAMAQVEIQKSKVKLATNAELIGLPVKSKEFSYKCEDGDLTCSGSGDDDGGCAVSSIDDGNSGIFMLFAAIALFLGFAFRIRKPEK